MNRTWLIPVLLLPSCGYHVAGHADALPKNVRTIAIPAFRNTTTRYKLPDLLAAAITHEFIARTRYRVVADPQGADAVLSGAVVNFYSYPTLTVSDPKTGTVRAAAAEAIVILQISLRDRGGTLLYNQPGMQFRQRYEVSVDPKSYFDESDVAMQRLSRDVARYVVSAILEKF